MNEEYNTFFSESYNEIIETIYAKHLKTVCINMIYSIFMNDVAKSTLKYLHWIFYAVGGTIPKDMDWE